MTAHSPPAIGRLFSAERAVRLGDAAPDGRLRLDALARYLQDVAEDDAADAGMTGSIGWVVRRTRIEVDRFPQRTEPLRLETYCSATARSWAERTTLGSGAGGGSFRAEAVWVALDLRRGRPAHLGDDFRAVYGPSASGRKASIRLGIAPPPPDGVPDGVSWPLRRADFDAFGHVNNAISWAALEEVLGDGAVSSLDAVVEHNEAILPGDELVLVSRPGPPFTAWLIGGGRVRTSMRAITT